MPRFVLKIGGSFITEKSSSDLFPATLEGIKAERDRFVRMDRLRSIAGEIAHAFKTCQIVLVHGAGPFGHALVQRSLSGARVDPLDIHRSMLVLNSVVRDALREAGVPSTTSSPFDLVTHDGRFHAERLISAMARDAERGLMPTCHGDLVPTTTGGLLGPYEVISGDVLASDLALGWSADKIVMVTDTDGILDRDPAQGGGKRIPRIGEKACVELLRGRGRKGADVTGGIASKIAACHRPLSHGIPVHVISGENRGDLLAAVAGLDVGTIIEAR